MSEPIKPAGDPEAQKPVSDLVEKAAEEVRKQPVKSLVWAFFVGIFLTIFPISRILGLLTGIILGLVRPMLLLLGLVKISEFLNERRK
jgi:hypothetical protein